MFGASPFGCSVVRNTLTGASSSSAATPSTSMNAASFAPTSSQRRSISTAGYGSWPFSSASIAPRNVCISGACEIGGVVRRCVPGRDEQRVAIAQRYVEMLGEVQDHLAARPRPARLHEAQVPGRHARRVRELELAEAPARAPVAQQLTDGYRDGLGDHAHRRYRAPRARTITSQGIDRPPSGLQTPSHDDTHALPLRRLPRCPGRVREPRDSRRVAQRRGLERVDAVHGLRCPRRRRPRDRPGRRRCRRRARQSQRRRRSGVGAPRDARRRRGPAARCDGERAGVARRDRRRRVERAERPARPHPRRRRSHPLVRHVRSHRRHQRRDRSRVGARRGSRRHGRVPRGRSTPSGAGPARSPATSSTSCSRQPAAPIPRRSVSTPR